MTSFKITIEGKYGVKTYQETKNTYDWIIRSLRKAGLDCTKLEIKFLFDLGAISCSCNSIEEFVSNAYGASEYSLTDMSICVVGNTTGVVFVSVNHKNQLYISVDNKNSLEHIVDLLNKTTLSESEINEAVSVTFIGSQYNNAPAISGNNNTVNITSHNEEPKIKQWIKAVAQNILANWIWYLLTIAATAAITYFATR